MSIFHPDVFIKRASDITPELLEKLGTRALILDVDNTLTTHNNPLPDNDILLWLDNIKKLGIHIVILSNNKPQRVKAFAQELSLEYTANARKPLKKGFRETSIRLNVSASEMTIVGDQIFTDILGGNCFGAKTILVEPMELETDWVFRLKRHIENRILLNYKNDNF